MYNHAPKNYVCPLCKLASGKNTDKTGPNDVVYQDRYLTAFIAGRWWINNPGHIIVIPNKHYENLYDMPDDLLGKIYAAAKKMAIIMKIAYKCDGTSTRQHNEPAGNQKVWHFHVHVFPRYEGDNLYKLHDKKHWTTPEQRLPYVNKIKKYIK
jgi:histidine triad (HIT) family protein